MRAGNAPNICLISEEVSEKKMSLSQIADYIADSVEKRAAKGMNFGVAIIPEGVVEFVPEFSALIQEINELLAGSKADAFNALATWSEKYAFIEQGLTKESMASLRSCRKTSSSSCSWNAIRTATSRFP